jgi:WD40 repeat protein
MSSAIVCPSCGSAEVIFRKKRQVYECEDCEHTFAAVQPFQPLRIFLSYGHDEYAALARRLKNDLQVRGHQVWFDADRLVPGADWEAYIEEGLSWVAAAGAEGRVVLLMTPHSVRRPDGYCLNEIARTLARGLSVLPVMVVWCEPPLSLCRLQWLDMQDCVPLDERLERYQSKLERLTEALEQGRLDFEGVQARLCRLLKPLPFEADLDQHLSRFTGRRWLFERLDAWLADGRASRVFWITGPPGFGKTALASWFCAHRREVGAFHLCRHGHDQKADPRQCVLSIAFQLSSQLPDYQLRLNALHLEKSVEESNARTLFDTLIVGPLGERFPRPDRTILVVIDALDEATKDGKNELASFLASEFTKTPGWLRLVLTSRPDPEVMYPLQGLTPYVLDASTIENERDIREFLARELKPFAPGGEIPAAAVDLIVARSEGLFLYVEWIRQELAEGRLELERIDRFPRGLGGVYVQFFERQFPDLADYETRVRPVLDVVAAAREPLPLDLLAALFRWNEHAQTRFCRSLGSQFLHGDGRIQAFHKSVMDWLTDAHRAGPYFVSVKEGHATLAAYGWQRFRENPARLPEYFLRHLPQHLLARSRWDELGELLTSWRFLEAKTEAGLVFDLAVDLSAAVKAVPADHQRLTILRLLEEAIRTDIHFLARHPKALFQCLWNRCWWYDCPEAGAHYIPPGSCGSTAPPPWDRPGPHLHILLEEWRAAKEAATAGFRWVRSLRPPSDPLSTTQEVVLRGHGHPVRGVAFSPDGRRIVSGAHDGTVRVWDRHTGSELLCLKGHEKWVTSVAFSPDGRRIVSGSDDGTVRVWDAERGGELLCLRVHRGGVQSVAFSPDGCQIISGGGEGNVQVWDSQTMITARVPGVDLPDKGTVRLWDAESGRALACLRGHADEVVGVAFAPDGRRIASCSADHTVRVWDADAGKEALCLRGHQALVRKLAFSPDGSLLASASDDRTLRVWDSRNGAELRCLTGHQAMVRAVAFSPDGRSLVSGGYEGAVRIWDVATGAERLCLRGHWGIVNGVAFAPEGSHVVSGAQDRTVRLWDLQTGAGDRPTLHGHTNWLDSLAFSPDGRLIVTGSMDGTVRLWDGQSGMERRCLRGHTDEVWCVAFRPDGHRLASGSRDKTVRIWNVSTGEVVACLRGHERRVSRVAFAPDGGMLASASDDRTVRLWRVAEGVEACCLRGHTDAVWCVAYSPDGQRVASGSADQTIRVWDVAGAHQVICLRGHENTVNGIAFSPDGQRLVSTGWDKMMRVWNVTSGRCLDAFEGYGDVAAVAAGPERFPLRAMARGWETVVENAATGEEVAVFLGTFYHLASHPGGRSWAGAAGNHLFLFRLEGRE